MTFTMVGMVFQKKKRCQPHSVSFFFTKEKYPCRQFCLLCRIGALSGYIFYNNAFIKEVKISFPYSVMLSSFIIPFPYPLAYHYSLGIILYSRMAHFLFRILLKPFKNMKSSEYCVPIQILCLWTFIAIRLLDCGTHCLIRVTLRPVKFVSIRSTYWREVTELKRLLVSDEIFLRSSLIGQSAFVNKALNLSQSSKKTLNLKLLLNDKSLPLSYFYSTKKKICDLPNQFTNSH